MTRCSLLLAAALALPTLSCPAQQAPSTPALAQPPAAGQEYRLHMKHLHTDESVDIAYRRGDQVIPGSIAMLNHFLRDWRTGDDAHYTVDEFDLLHTIMQRLGRPNGLIEIICGYRTPDTNHMLRTRAPVTGVAENSQHILSRAIDIRVPGVSTAHLRDVALALDEGGVGFYPHSQFVHVDLGPVRQWSYGATRGRHHRGHARVRSRRRRTHAA